MSAIDQRRISPLSARKEGIFFVFILLALLLGGCGDYTARTRGALADFQSRNFEAALKGYEKESGSDKDRLLYLIDKGIVLHTAGRYEESIKILQEADDYADKIDYFSISREIGALFVNERMKRYKGEAFERVLINVYKAIDYIMLGNIEGALVECRKIDLKLEKFNKFLKTNQRDPFPRYISGVLYETDNEINDAYIDYKKAYRIDPDFYYLAGDLLRLSKALDFTDDYGKWQKIFGSGKLRKNYGNYGEVILIFENGLSPMKVSSERKAQAQIIPVPVYVDRPSEVSHAEIYKEQKKIGRTYLLSDIGKLSKVYLDKRISALIARGIARLAIKTGAAVAVGKATDSPELGILTGILLMYTNRADLRSALTLPENIQLSRVFLPQGTHDLEVRLKNRHGGYAGFTKTFKGVKVSKNRRTFLNFRSFR